MCYRRSGEQIIFRCKEWRSKIESSDNLALLDNQLSNAKIARSHDYDSGGLGSTHSFSSDNIQILARTLPPFPLHRTETHLGTVQRVLSTDWTVGDCVIGFVE